MSSQVKLNKNVTIGIVVGAILLILGIVLLKPSEHDKIAKAYEDLDNTHIFENVSYKEFEKLGSTESGKYLVVISRPTCGHCQELLPEIDRAAKSYEIDVIYYLNPEELSSGDLSDLQSIYGIGSSTPNLLAMEDNKVLESSKDWLDIDTNSDNKPDNAKYDSEGKIDYYRTYRSFINEFYNN